MSKLSFVAEMEADNDDNFFGNLRSRRLGQLFEVEGDSEPQTLKYQPIKQSLNDVAAISSWSTLLAKVANAYKEGESIGKVGVALLSNADGDCKLIAYKTKTNVLATLSVIAASAIAQLYRQSGYLQFYDDNNVYWSLRFDKETDEKEFLLKLQEKGVPVDNKIAEEEVSTKAKTNQVDNVPDLVKEQPSTSKQYDEHFTTTRDTTKPSVPHTKSQLISRMAKMGQQLPRLTDVREQYANTTNEYSDSSDTEVIATPLSLGNKPSVLPRSSKLQARTQLVATTTDAVMPMTTMGVYNAANVGIATVNPMESQFLQMLLSENRTQNSEMRMNLGKLEGKLEKVLDKINCLDVGDNNKQKTNKDDELLELEEKLLELKKANRKLKQTLEGREQRNDGKLLERILQFHQIDMKELDVEPIADVEALVATLLEKNKQQQDKLEKSEAKEQRSGQELRQQQAKLEEEQQEHIITQKKMGELEQSIKDLQTKLTLLQKQNEELEENLTAQQKSHTAEIQQQQLAKADTVKAIMNSLYGNLVGKIGKLDELRQDDVLSIIGYSIKEETLKAINAPKQ